MRTLFQESLTVMSNAFNLLEKQVPPPKLIAFKDGYIFRYTEKSIQQALIQKLARYTSGLGAIDILLSNGFVQEQGVISRTLDEIHEDMFFLSAAITNDSITPSHEQYLTAFYQDAIFNQTDVTPLFKKPNLVPRKKIRSYIRRVLNQGIHDEKSANAGENISTVFSGYVHASSENIMDMYGGNPAHFHLNGMKNTPRMSDHTYDAWNYFYRGLLTTTLVAKAFGDKHLVDVLYEYMKKFEKASGTTFFQAK